MIIHCFSSRHNKRTRKLTLAGNRTFLLSPAHYYKVINMFLHVRTQGNISFLTLLFVVSFITKKNLGKRRALGGKYSHSSNQDQSNLSPEMHSELHIFFTRVPRFTWLSRPRKSNITTGFGPKRRSNSYKANGFKIFQTLSD